MLIYKLCQVKQELVTKHNTNMRSILSNGNSGKENMHKHANICRQPAKTSTLMAMDLPAFSGV